VLYILDVACSLRNDLILPYPSSFSRLKNCVLSLSPTTRLYVPPLAASLQRFKNGRKILSGNCHSCGGGRTTWAAYWDRLQMQNPCQQCASLASTSLSLAAPHCSRERCCAKPWILVVGQV
jgi:hypothetical protein